MKKREVRVSPYLIPPIFHGYFVVAASFFIVTVMYAAFYSFGVFFKPLLNEFGWTRAIISGAFSLSTILLGLMSILMGGLNDRFGPRIVLTLCAFLLSLGYFLMSQISTAWQLYMIYGLIIGTGMGGSFVPVMSTVARWFTKRRSMMTGIIAAGIGVGASVGPPTVHQLIYNYGWRVSFIILAVIVLGVVLLSAQLIKSKRVEIGLSSEEQNDDKQKELNLDFRNFSFKEAVFSNKFWILFALFFCFGFCVLTILVHIVPYATEQGISPLKAANILASIGLLSIVGKVVMGKVADKIGSWNTYLIGIILLTAAFFWLIPAILLWKLYLFAAVFGFAYGTCVTSQSPLVALMFGLSSHGLILGFLVFGFTIGGAIGPLIAGYMFDIIESYRQAFSVCAIFGLISIMLTILLKKDKHK